jgi:hypothetical protein
MKIKSGSVTRLASALRNLNPEFEEIVFILFYIMQNKNLCHIFGGTF